MFIGLGILVWFAHPTHLPLGADSRPRICGERRAEELIEEVP